MKYEDMEALNKKLNDPEQLEEYSRTCDEYQPALIPQALGRLLILCGDLVYGKDPSYLKFRAIEVIARVPYHSWGSAAYTLLTLFYTNTNKAMRLSEISRFAKIAQDNETMHVVVISELSKRERTRAGFFRYTCVPLFFSFFYFWATYLLYLLKPRYSYEMNYIFEQHAFEQYGEFLEQNKDALLKKSVDSRFLTWYGRDSKDQYEFFRSVRNDELIHRNESIREIERLTGKQIQKHAGNEDSPENISENNSKALSKNSPTASTPTAQ